MLMCRLCCVIDHQVSTIHTYVQENVLCDEVGLRLHLWASDKALSAATETAHIGMEGC